MSEHHLDIVRQVLDQQVVDYNNVYCGRVDDIVIDLKGKPKVTAILIGNGPASDRLPEFARWLSRKLFGTHRVKIPWDEVLVIKDVVKLASHAEEYGIDERKGWAYELVSKFPGAWKK
jgi:sporulation protein YlmC with PRC-barrel domain